MGQMGQIQTLPGAFGGGGPALRAGHVVLVYGVAVETAVGMIS
jgi:hypothetical protein